MIEIAIHKPHQSSHLMSHQLRSPSHSLSPSGFQPLRSHIVSSYYDEDEPEIFEEKEMQSSPTSSLSNYTSQRRRSRTTPQTSAAPCSTTSIQSPKCSTQIIPYSLSDVKLNCSLYAGPVCFDSERVLTELRTHCRQVLYSKSDENTLAIVAKSLSSLKTINLIILYLDPHFNISPAVLIGRLRKMGYCGFAILIADVATSPDTSDRFLKCGGDGILSKPVVNRRAIHRVLIGTILLIAPFLSFPHVLSYYSESHRLLQKSAPSGDYFERKTTVMFLEEKEHEI